jgi:glycosyltransferase involved in cell wall biosynthesis
VSENSKPLVSILLVIRNVERNIKKCLVSLFKQSYDNIEIILIDDFSSDRTVELCNEIILKFNKKNFNVKFIRNSKQLGLTKNLNIGIKLSEGEFIARQDGDDWSHNKRIERQVTFFINNPTVDLLGTSFYVVDKFRIFKIFFSTKNSKPYDYHGVSTKAAKMFPHGSYMFNGDKLREHLYNECCLFCQDFEIVTWYCKNNFRLESLNEGLYYHVRAEAYNDVKLKLKEEIHLGVWNHYDNNNTRFFNDILIPNNISGYTNDKDTLTYYFNFLKIFIGKFIYKY